MNYQKFSDFEEAIKKAKLGGINAQLKLAPEVRKKLISSTQNNKTHRKAAVLALFYPDSFGETHLLLTLRASYKGTHSAQISFPGGKYETTDTDLSYTAVRECFEEVGVPNAQIRLIKEMTDVYIPPSNFMVTPFIGFSDTLPSFKINHEVAELVEVSLKDVLNDASVFYDNMDTSYAKNSKTPYFKLKNKVVWGATAMIISEIKELLKSL